MAGLTDTTIAASYDQLLIVDRDGGGNGTTHVAVKDGDGTTTFPVTLASDAIMITSTNRLEFGDDASYIHQSEDGVLDLVSDTEIEINATTIDINGALDVSGNITMADDTSIGIGDSAERIEFDGTGDISVLGANFGIGTDSPVSLLTIKDSTGDSDGIAKGLVLLADDSGQHTSSDIAGIITFAGRNAGGTNKISAQITSPSSSNWNDTVANGYGQIAFSVGQGSAVNEKMRVTNNGVGIGTISPSSLLSLVKESADCELRLDTYSDTEAQSNYVTFRKADGSEGSPALVDDNAILGGLSFQGHDGSGWHESASIKAQINGTPSDGTDMPTELLFATANEAEGSPTVRMNITPTGDVHIGTANEGLSINGNTGGAGTITGINQALSAYKKLVLNATDFSFKISGSEKMAINTSGNATFAGDVTITSANNPSLYITSSEANTDNFRMYVGGTGLSFFNTTDTRGVYFKHNNDWQFGDANGTVNTEWYGEGNAKIVATAGSASNPTYCFNSDTSTGMYRPANVQLAFATDGTERLRITGTGDIWHNNGNTVEHALAGHTNELNISHHWNSGQATIHFCYRMENTYTDFTFYNGSGSGHPDLNAASFDTTSDYRMKKSVANFTDNVCDKIKLLRPITYNWKANTKMNETKQIGFLAHELQEQLPLAVKGEKDAMSEKDDTLIAPQSIKGEALSSYMMKALQEIITRLEALENA